MTTYKFELNSELKLDSEKSEIWHMPFQVKLLNTTFEVKYYS